MASRCGDQRLAVVCAPFLRMPACPWPHRPHLHTQCLWEHLEPVSGALCPAPWSSCSWPWPLPLLLQPLHRAVSPRPGPASYDQTVQLPADPRGPVCPQSHRGTDRGPTSLLPQSSTSRQVPDSAQNSPSHLPGIPPWGVLRSAWGAGPPSGSGPSPATGTPRLSATASGQKHSCLPTYILNASGGPRSSPDSRSPVMPSTICAHQEQEGALWPG